MLVSPEISLPPGVTPPFDMMWKQKLIDSYEFSFFLSTTNGEPRPQESASSLAVLSPAPLTQRAPPFFSSHASLGGARVRQRALSSWKRKATSGHPFSVFLSFPFLSRCASSAYGLLHSPAESC